MRNILVTAISGNVSNGILKILKDTKDNVYGCDIYDYPVGMDKVITYWKSDLAKSEKYIPNLLEKCKEYQISHLIPVNEKEIEVISEHRLEFERIGIKILIQTKNIVDIFLDKYNTYMFLEQISGVNVPKTVLVNQYVNDGKCYIMKLRSDCGSKFLKIIKNSEDLENIVLDGREYVLQEYLPDEENEYTVGVFSNGKCVNTIIYRRKLEHGYTSFVEFVKDEEIDNIAKLIAKKIELKGYINIQLRKKDGKNYIFEINPRISGTVYFRHLLGFTDVLWWLKLLDGENKYIYEDKYKKAIGMRELSEKYVVVE